MRADRGPTDAAYRRARAALRSGAERAGARAHFRAMGIDPDRLDGADRRASPRRGRGRCRATSPSASSPRTAAEAVEAAGGVPLEFNTIAVSDNQTQGTPGMRASLVSREVIADSIELMAHRARLRRAGVPRRLRQDDAGGADGAGARRQAGGRALQRADAGRAAARPRARRSRTCGRRSARTGRAASTARGARRARAPRVPRPGHVRRALHGQHDGGRARLPRPRRPRRRARSRPTTGRRRREAAGARRAARGRAGRRAAGRRGRSSTPRRCANAMAGVAATGGSTNGLLHLLAIAREAGVEHHARRAGRGAPRARR